MLDEIVRAEEQLAPAATELFMRARSVGRKPVSLLELQRQLRGDEVFLEFALSEPSSYVVVATRRSARVRRLAGRSEIRTAVRAITDALRAGRNIDTDARRVSTLLLDGITELRASARVISSADGDQLHLPFELLVRSDGKRLLESHVVSYVPSGSALVTLRTRPRSVSGRLALAVASSPSTPPSPATSASTQGSIGAVTRGVYDVDATKLPALPSANDEARAVISAFGQSRSTILVDASATEQTVKREPLHEYAVLHFAAHGIVSTKFPARSALFLQPGGEDDGLLQAREILRWRLGAELVTLSACGTGTGEAFGQEGVASLVRPFLAAGARSVVANLWTADDFFSLALMREFYRHLASSADVGQALRLAKISDAGAVRPASCPQALERRPRLWRRGGDHYLAAQRPVDNHSHTDDSGVEREAAAHCGS